MSDKTAWLHPERSHHAELPVWCEQSQTLLFVDMEPSPSVHRVRGDEYTRFAFEGQEIAGGVFFRRGAAEDEVYVGTKLGFGSARLDAEKKQVVDYEELVNVQKVTKGKNWKPVRLNEATTDARGRIWFATCKEGDTDVKPTLYLFDPSQRSLVEVPCSPAELTMPNAMCFSGDSFYLGCSIAGKVWRWKVNLDADPAAMLSEGELFLEVPKPQVPDGATVDTEGNLYVAIFNGGCVQVFDPSGERIHTISLPAQSPTCPVFGGANLNQLIVTTHAVDESMRKEVVDAGQAASIAELQERWPDDKGGLYRVKLGADVTGIVKPHAL